MNARRLNLRAPGAQSPVPTWVTPFADRLPAAFTTEPDFFLGLIHPSARCAAPAVLTLTRAIAARPGGRYVSIVLHPRQQCLSQAFRSWNCGPGLHLDLARLFRRAAQARWLLAPSRWHYLRKPHYLPGGQFRRI